MQTIIINIGVSGSGKTTWSTSYINQYPNFMRINRDDLRKTIRGSLTGYYEQKDLNKIEGLITDWEANMLVTMLRKGYDLILDNTHLKSSYIKEKISLIEYWSDILGIPVEIKFKIFPLDNAWTLKSRVKERDGRFEADYIDKQLLQLKSVISYVEENYKNQILE